MSRKSLLALIVVAAFTFGAFAVSAEKVPVPENSGFYVFDNGKLTELTKQYTKRKELEIGKKKDKKEFLGFSDDGIQWQKFSKNAVFVLYDARVEHDQANFRSLYFEGKREGRKSEYWQLNMWVRDKKVRVKLREHDDKNGVWVFTPDTSSGTWNSGRYCVYFGDSMNKARKDDTPKIFNWEIK